MKIAVTSSLPGDALSDLARRHTVLVREETDLLDQAALIRFIADADGVITLLADPVSEQVMAACPKLKVVANYAVGFNNIDLEAARRRGIWVTNTPDVLTDATADLTWALLLAMTRRLGEGEELLRSGGYAGWRPEMLLGLGLQGQTLGIVGFGRIGRAVAQRATGFGMQVLLTDAQPALAEDARYRPLDELLAASKVLSLHCPATPDTHHLLDERRLALLPRGAYLINTARGQLVDEAALVRALERGHLAGAGLDVYENEPEVHQGLLGRSDVVLLPHIGSATVAARTAMADLAVANLAAVLEGRQPPTPVVSP